MTLSIYIKITYLVCHLFNNACYHFRHFQLNLMNQRYFSAQNTVQDLQWPTVKWISACQQYKKDDTQRINIRPVIRYVGCTSSLLWTHVDQEILQHVH